MREPKIIPGPLKKKRRLYKTSFGPKVDFSSPDFRKAVFQPESYSKFSLYTGQSAPQTTRTFQASGTTVSAEQLEKQLDEEFRKDKDIIAAPSHRTKKRIYENPMIPSSILDEQNALETIDKWERDKLVLTQRSSQYTVKKLTEIDKEIKENVDKLMKEKWVQKNTILNVPSRILQDLVKHRMQKRVTQTSVPNLTHYIDETLLKKTNTSSSAAELIKNSNYFKNALHLRKRLTTCLSSMEATKIQNKDLLKLSDSGKSDSAFGLESDRQLVMHHEIGLELKSQALQRVIMKKKSKHAEIALQNNSLIQQMQKLEGEIFSLGEERKKKAEYLSTTPRILQHQYTLINMEKYKAEIAITQKKQAQVETKKQIQHNIARLSKLQNKISELKAQIANLRSMQLAYYHTLLYEGLESRKEGLIWILKGIWLLGYNVNLSKMPPFLDEHAIEFLFKYAKLDMAAEELQKELRSKAVESRKEKMQEIAMKTSMRMRSSKKLLAISPKSSSMEESSVEGSPICSSTRSDKELIELEKKLDYTKRKIRDLKQTEIARISKEYATNNYEKKYGVSQRLVLAALVGEDAARVECEKKKSRLTSTYYQFGKYHKGKGRLTTLTPLADSDHYYV